MIVKMEKPVSDVYPVGSHQTIDSATGSELIARGEASLVVEREFDYSDDEANERITHRYLTSEDAEDPRPSKAGTTAADAAVAADKAASKSKK